MSRPNYRIWRATRWFNRLAARYRVNRINETDYRTRIAYIKENRIVWYWTIKNIDRHCPDHDIFNPGNKKLQCLNRRRTNKKAICELCKTETRSLLGRMKITLSGMNTGIMLTLMATGFSLNMERCPHTTEEDAWALHLTKNGKYEQCDYRWSLKTVPNAAENDIAARYCTECKAEIIDPNKKLIADFRARKRDP